ncbi:hypothetical protein NHQ30_007031 [Ciborinia camelliae]|nr:hypothetical protein NHQ30_007031 [Ciborinia camelliae]
MMNMPTGQKTNETKPRLGKEEVDILEREFIRNPKPTTQTKRGFAEDMGVDLSRINNWFQNRRAKRKQEKKTEAYEAGQAREALGFSGSAPSSPEFSQNNYNTDYQMVPQQQSSMSFPSTGPPAATASYNPQYPDPSIASIESLTRTLVVAQAAAQAASHGGEFSTSSFRLHHNGPLPLENMIGTAEPSDLDRAIFPITNNPITNIFSPFTEPPYIYPPELNGGVMYHEPEQMYHEPEQLDPYVTAESGHPPMGLNAFSDGSTTRQLSTAPVSSLAIPHSFSTILTFRPHESGDNQALGHSNAATSSITQSLDEDSSSSQSTSSSPPPPGSSFLKSPPPPTDLVARRKKVHKKPAALRTGGRPQIGPKTISNVDGFLRQVGSPLNAPMRRIVSAGGNSNRNVLTGRIQKAGIESAQRSPINMQGFENFMEHNSHMMRNPSMTASSSVTSSLAPATPISPRERQMSLKRENTSSREELNYSFNLHNHGLPTFIDASQTNDQTPTQAMQDALGLQATSTSGWPNNTEPSQEQLWDMELTDAPLYSSNHDSFATESSMHQTSYSSQPVTPAFGSLTQGGFLSGNGHDSPQFINNPSPSYTLSNQGASAEYSFPHDGYPLFPTTALVGSSPTMMTKPKQYQFSNVTQADYSEK